jgi:small subunit ribosomal protein S6e
MQKIILSDTDGKAYTIELDEKKAKALIGKEIGGMVEGEAMGLGGYKIQITGGSDRDGFPMRGDVHGRVRPRILLGRGPGYRPKESGVKRRKRVRGRVITPDIVQINARVLEKGKKSLAALLGKGTAPKGKEAEKSPEKPPEEKPKKPLEQKLGEKPKETPKKAPEEEEAEKPKKAGKTPPKEKVEKGG